MPPADHPPGAVYDPYEDDNRKAHEINKTLDTVVIRPVGMAYTTVLPDDVETMVSNFGDNLSLPSAVVNNLLQGNLKGAWNDTMRFVVNSTLGIGGVADAATDLRMAQATDADFGQTLAVWGVQEGAYLELPVFGPGNERDHFGRFVDGFTNPLNYVLPDPEVHYRARAKVVSRIGDRARYRGIVDTILYDSADSYAQTRGAYIQNRRYQIGEIEGEAYIDPYNDPYSDPYEDPYAQ